jgi:hypothetical protein
MTVTTGKKGRPKDFKNKNPKLTKITPKKEHPWPQNLRLKRL